VLKSLNISPFNPRLMTVGLISVKWCLVLLPLRSASTATIYPSSLPKHKSHYTRKKSGETSPIQPKGLASIDLPQNCGSLSLPLVVNTINSDVTLLISTRNFQILKRQGAAYYGRKVLPLYER
jgi:hypothetical protein